MGVFSHSDPVTTGKTPKADPIRNEDSNVSTQTGSFEYSYLIVVPPGRGGATPSLTLRYSSQGALYGTFAAGWTLQLPEIRFDPKQSVITVAAATEERRYVATQSGNRVLIPIVEPADADVLQTYRAKVDDQYIRYERLDPSSGAAWRARTLDGSVYTFGEGSNLGQSSIGNMHHGIARLTSMRDVHGNTVEYFYTPVGPPNELVPFDYQLTNIAYSSHNTITGHHAEVRFETVEDHCEGGLTVGSKLTFRSGGRHLSGARRVSAITTWARVQTSGALEQVRRYEFAYDATGLSCSSSISPIRLLLQVTEKAKAPGIPWGDGTWSELPPVTFQYGPLSRGTLDQAVGLLHSPLAAGDRRPAGQATQVRFLPTLEVMHTDFNGDGLIDRLQALNGSCDVDVFLNQGSGFLMTPSHTFSLPTMSWRGASPDPGLEEGCSLTAQYSAYFGEDHQLLCHFSGSYLSYKFTDMHGDGLPDLLVAANYDGRITDTELLTVLPYGNPPCGAGGQCPDVDDTCYKNAGGCTRVDDNLRFCPPADRFYGCASTAPKVPCGNLILHKKIAPDANPNKWPPPPIISVPPIPALEPSDPQTMFCERSHHEGCNEGEYVWALYPNIGGTIDTASPPELITSPIPLESNAADTPFGPASNGFVGARNALIDIDGDGFLDAVMVDDRDPLPYGLALYVWRGNGTGHLGDGPYPWWTPKARLSRTYFMPNGQGCSGADVFANGTFGALQDMNGDGLVDLLWYDPETDPSLVQEGVYTYFSRRAPGPEGTPEGAFGFLSDQGSPGDPERSSVEISDMFAHAGRTCVDVREWQHTYPKSVAVRAFAESDVRLLDYDGDGRVDLYFGIDQRQSVTLSRGDGSFARDPTANNIKGLSSQDQDMLAKHTDGDFYDSKFPWITTREFLDVNGDSLPDAIVGNTLGARVYTDEYGDHPMRLMKRIDNGRGLITEVGYGRHNDSSIVDNTGSDNVPNNFFVVTYLRRNNGVCADPSNPVGNECNANVETTYTYADMVFNNSDGRYRFRGFERARATMPNSSIVEQTYDYVVDPTGRLASTTRYATAGGAPHVISIELYLTSQFSGLFGGQTKSYHRTRTQRFTCGNEDTYLECLLRPPLITKWQYSPITASGSSLDLAYQKSHQLDVVGSGGLKDGDKINQLLYILHSGPTQYLLRTTHDRKWEYVAGVHVTRAASYFEWSDDGLFLDREQVAISDTEWAVTARTYHATGVVEAETRPNQEAAGSGIKTVYEYDPDRIFRAKTTRQQSVPGIDIVTERTVDYGTGQTLSERGPNRDTSGTWAESRTEIDGFGRAVRTYTTDEGAGTYIVKWTGETIYDDAAIPSRVTSRTRVDFGGAQWVTQHRRVDGMGRVVLIETETELGLATEVFRYDDAGRLTEYETPSPTGSGRALYRYAYDTVDRLREISLPDAGSGVPRVKIEYDGFSTMRTEIPNDGSLGAEKQTVVDHFGRLVAVHERIDASSFATTTYAYDGIDNLILVTDAEGHVTTLSHDLRELRTQITRGGRTWEYQYDKNGNMTAEIAPIPAGGLPAEYTTTIVYDELDRPTSRTTATRGMSAARAAELGVGITTYTYDTCAGGRGALCEVELPYGGSTITYAYDARGNIVTEVRSVTLPSGESIERQQTTRYNAMGQADSIRLPDSETVPQSTEVLYSFDVRGLPVRLQYVRNGQNVAFDAAYLVRNLSGRPILRTQSPGDTAANSVSAEWIYDSHGRVTGLHVTAPGGVTRTHQSITYHNNGNVAGMDHNLDGATRRFDYDYDHRHQLVRVDGSQADYHVVFAYGAAGRLETASFAGSEVVVPRDVSYRYASGGDPEFLERLEHNVLAGDFASYTHDASGNITQRLIEGDPTTSSDDVTYDAVYAGEDWQREVVRSGAGGTATERYFYDHTGSRIFAVQYDTSGAIQTAKYWFGATEIRLTGDAQGGFVLDKSIGRASLGQPVARFERSGSNGPVELSHVYHSPLEHMLVALNDNGQVEAGYSYGPFGEVLDQIGPNTGDYERRFNGKDFDSASGLSYYGARYYDSLSMMWTQGDPLYRFAPDAAYDEPRRMNLYSFSLNNPVKYVDPDGRKPGSQQRRQIVFHISPNSKLGQAPTSVRKRVEGSALQTIVSKIELAAPGSIGGGSAGLGLRTGRPTNSRKKGATIHISVVSPNADRAHIVKRVRAQGHSQRTAARAVEGVKLGGATSKAKPYGGKWTSEAFVNGDTLDLSNPEVAGANLGTIAAHEVGHSVGVKHSDAEDDIDLATDKMLDPTMDFGPKASARIRHEIY